MKTLKYILFIVSTIFLIGFLLKGTIPHEPFDSEKWKSWIKSNSESDMSLRWDMMNSLRKNYELKGMTRDEIIDLLGEPQRKDQVEFIYNLGYSKHGVNTGSFTIRFGNNDKVTNFSVWEG